MRLRLNLILVGSVALVAAISVAGTVWYQRDRVGMLGRLCQAGLPNFSRPANIEAKELGCAVLGPRRRVDGVLLTAFEAANFIENDLPPPPEGGGFTGSTWWTTGRKSKLDEKLDQQLELDIPGLCDLGLAKVTAYGWATESPGEYGHLGVYAREFFADEIVAVGPPPPKLVSQMQRRWARDGIGECD